jgi:prevent-host-death family protein
MYVPHMSKRYSIAQARSTLPSIVDDAESGIDIELTRRGKPVAAIVSLKELTRLRRQNTSFGAAYQNFLQKHSLSKVGLTAKKFADKRDRHTGRKVSF